MTIPDYGDHGLIASTWDLWRNDTADGRDRHFYLGEFELTPATAEDRQFNALGVKRATRSDGG